MISAAEPSIEELRKEVSNLTWVHRIDLGNGLVTPGLWGAHNPSLWNAIKQIDYRGRKVLDIGCWDGLWSFEAEKRGATEVYATDLLTNRPIKLPTFELAQRILKSNVKHFPHLPVYNVEQLGIADFDIVLFAGVYYHLKDPLRALSCLRRVMKEGGILVVEGAIIDLEAERGRKSSAGGQNDCFARFYYRNQFFGDRTNWWVPTVPRLRQWIECNFFEIESEEILHSGSEECRRCTIIARAVRRKDPLYIREDEDLRAFDLNQYS